MSAGRSAGQAPRQFPAQRPSPPNMRPAQPTTQPAQPRAQGFQNGAGRPADARGATARPGYGRAGRAPARTANRPAALNGWTSGQPAEQRSANGRQWRDDHRGWSNSAVWAGNPNWWRNSRAFSRYDGVRTGFFFIPGRGYISAPREYEHRYWAAGEMLPQWFWQYGVGAYDDYGLPQPPEGCAWIWVDDDVVLIDLSDGYILDVVRSVW